MNSFLKKLQSINSNNIILYNHAARKLTKTKNKIKTKFNFYFKEIAFETLYHLTTKEARFTIQAIFLILSFFQFKNILYYLYNYDQKLPFMSYYVADDLEKYDTENIRLIEIDELNAKKIKYANEIKYY